RWSREQFTARLRSAGVAPGEFAIPKVIEIRREAQPVPAAAVHEAIATFLHRTLAPADIRFTPPLTTATTPVVAVLRSVPDLVHGRLEVICRAQNDPRLLPFAVSVRMPAAALARQELRRGVQKSDAAVRTPLVPQPELVKPGRMAKLVISQPGFAMTTLVQPLQAGRKGDHIRVRSLATKAILQVLVTGHDQVGILPRSLAILPQGGIHGRN
ncbi:MAG: flagella basal body P-ring formation protein FlgA, partial [Terriglobales bacterium]